MSDPISLRNIPPDALTLAHTLSTQTGLSLNAVFRLALASGLLVEITKVTPGPDGTLGGREPASLAKALRRHLSSAIDLLVEYGEHPYQGTMGQNSMPHQDNYRAPLEGGESAPSSPEETQNIPFEDSIGDDLETLGIGMSLAEKIENTRP